MINPDRSVPGNASMPLKVPETSCWVRDLLATSAHCKDRLIGHTLGMFSVLSWHCGQRMAAWIRSTTEDMAGSRGYPSANPVSGHHIFPTTQGGDEVYASTCVLRCGHILGFSGT